MWSAMIRARDAVYRRDVATETEPNAAVAVADVVVPSALRQQADGTPIANVVGSVPPPPMPSAPRTAKIIDGKALAAEVRARLSVEVAEFRAQTGRAPGLAVLLVGEDPASQVYVRNKEIAAREIGMVSEMIRLPADATQEQVEEAVLRLNRDDHIDGFLVQLPLPKGLNEERIVALVDPAKDADGLHPYNLGRLFAGLPAPRPCTPSGVIALLAHAGVDLTGLHAVVVGRSNIVGKPVATMLLEKNATVTVCHSRTRDLPDYVRTADVVVAALGKAEFIRGEWLKPGAVVIDVGINRVGEKKIVGDVEFAAASQRASAITPVPGGVGPMTIAMLLQNTLVNAQRRLAH